MTRTAAPPAAPERHPAAVGPAERIELGRAARTAAPRSSHAELPARRGKGALKILAAQDVGRVQDLLPIRYARMAISPFTFLRGSAAVMTADLADTPVSGIDVQLCGDAHLANFGFFASPERRLVFDLNDFDETLRGPWEWDVKRLAASVEVAGRDRGFRTRDRAAAVEAAVRAYRRAMRAFAAMTNLDVWYALVETDELWARYRRRVAAPRRARMQRDLTKARSRDNLGALNRFTAVVDGAPRIVAAPPIVVPIRDLYPEEVERRGIEDGIHELLAGYRESLPPDRRTLYDRYRPVDIAHKVVGVGSVGTRCWMLLFLGRDDRDPLFLQAKEAGPSALESVLGPAPQDSAGQRVVEGQRLMQAVGDIFLGWQRAPGVDGEVRDFYLRQLRDWKGSVEVESLRPQGLQIYAEICGQTLARAHARSGDRIAIAAYLGSSSSFDRAVADFARAYADRTETDHAALRRAIDTGRVIASDPSTDGQG
ncbi:DUF2252 domain-containing protein [Pseudonocardia halophobica]|uniref:DUF2252 domain-containing protein n=1 Tax=Pseudonocardia halophobica TaxID=29401 RepID=A0A9W6L4Q6_9PSEU|nr:DUF2252 domain-containing protein [Pseudonocardia halophobica]GLL12036.1 hypothetical protein GCM10017577_31770 [Pseudonocardia halophobica]